MKHPFFIIGAQRSGTTLLRLILNSHSEIAIPNEGTFWVPIIRMMRGKFSQRISGDQLDSFMRYISRNSKFAYWHFNPEGVFAELKRGGGCTLAELMDAVYCGYLESRRKGTWGDKTPSFFRMVDDLHQLFPHARFIHIVRDGRDTYLSYRRKDPSRRNLAVQALEWRYKIATVGKMFSRIDETQLYELRYEDLLASPQQTLESLCVFLDLRFEPGMLHFYEDTDDFVRSSHSPLLRRPLMSDNCRKWEQQLSPAENRMYERVAGPVLRRYEFPLRDAGTTLTDKMRLMVSFAVGLPMRVSRLSWTALVLHFSAKFGRATSAAGGKRRRAV